MSLSAPMEGKEQLVELGHDMADSGMEKVIGAVVISRKDWAGMVLVLLVYAFGLFAFYTLTLDGETWRGERRQQSGDG